MCLRLVEDLKKSVVSKENENEKFLNEILVAEKEKKLQKIEQNFLKLEEKMIEDKKEKERLFQEMNKL